MGFSCVLGSKDVLVFKIPMLQQPLKPYKPRKKSCTGTVRIGPSGPVSTLLGCLRDGFHLQLEERSIMMGA